jgi:hypothetical protein
MSDPSQTDRSVARERDPQDEVSFASWIIVGVFALAVAGLAFSAITSPRPNQTVVANRSGEAPVTGVRPLLEDETTGQAARPAR